MLPFLELYVRYSSTGFEIAAFTGFTDGVLVVRVATTSGVLFTCTAQVRLGTSVLLGEVRVCLMRMTDTCKWLM